MKLRVWSRGLAALLFIAILGPLGAPLARADDGRADEILRARYKLVLALIRHTPTYTPPVASRTLAYVGVTAYEAVASGRADMHTLAGQLHGLDATPRREAGASYDDAIALNAALSAMTHALFDNTGPTGQRAMSAVDDKLRARAIADVPADAVARSEDYGRKLAERISAWAQDDGGAVIENMGFPLTYSFTEGAAHWKATSLIAQQQMPLLPRWGSNRTFAMPGAATCGLPGPPAYSEDRDSTFYKQALEVYETTRAMTAEQRDIAHFWADDAMLSVTPPGHWVSIALQVLASQHAPIERDVDVLARVGVAVADGFIGCWRSKFQYDLLRPQTYIRRVIDAKWEPLLITPPFPEYPSGHSSQTGAAAQVMTKLFGDNFAFTDMTDRSDGLAPRSFPSFWAAAREAGISRMYGGIHFRAAIDDGLEQGRCIGEYTNALRTRD